MSENNKMKNSDKYLEENYSQDFWVRLFQVIGDGLQAQELSVVEEYMREYMKALKENREEHHYLVDGAILRCTRCTLDPVTPLDVEFYAPKDSNTVSLKVTENQHYKNGSGQYFATVKDCSKDNILPFGNCLNPPDREDEENALIIAGTSDELRQYGTCRYLRKLNDAWENLISDEGYQEITGLGGNLLETVTMEAILFCKHGGFIYPIDSGYIPTETDEIESEEELEEEFELDQSDPESVKKYMWQFFRDNGFSEVATAAILGNVEVESWGFQRDAQLGNSYYGLFQYGNNRKENFFAQGKEWAKEHGLPEEEGWKDVRFQCEYALWEYMESSDGWIGNRWLLGEDVVIGRKDDFESTKDLEWATTLWGLCYERCVDSTCIAYRTEDNKIVYGTMQNYQSRLDAAEKIYEDFAGK